MRELRPALIREGLPGTVHDKGPQRHKADSQKRRHHIRDIKVEQGLPQGWPIAGLLEALQRPQAVEGRQVQGGRHPAHKGNQKGKARGRPDLGRIEEHRRSRAAQQGQDKSGQGGEKQHRTNDFDEAVQGAVFPDQQNADAADDQQQGGVDDGQVEAEQIVQQSCGGKADSGDNNGHRADRNKQVEVEGPIPEALIAVDQAFSGRVRIA